MNKWRTLVLAPLMLMFSWSAMAQTCESLRYKSGDIITIHSARLMGGRIQLPANLKTTPVVSNAALWDVEGVPGTNQIVLKPNSLLPEGATTMIFAFTDDGAVYDIQAKRVSAAKNQPCIAVNANTMFFDKEQKHDLMRFVATQPVTAPHNSAADTARIRVLEKELKDAKAQTDKDTKRKVMQALNKYRYKIYTRYQWDSGQSFVGNNTIADVYDDGRFTFIRLANPNRGLLSVETVIGGKKAIAPTKYIDAYAMYQVTGIYPEFTLRVDNVKIEVHRTDNATTANL